jgi:hypothetical protein
MPVSTLPMVLRTTARESANERNNDMKLYSVAIGAGIGYLAGNQQARHKAAEFVRNLKSSPQAKAVEDKVSHKVSTLTDKAGMKGRSDDRAESDAFTASSTGTTSPSMVPH